MYPLVRSEAAFRPDRFVGKVLAESERTKVILACFEPGQFIPVHRPGVGLTLVVLEGQGRAVVGDQEHPLTPGAVAFVPAGQAPGRAGRDPAGGAARGHATPNGGRPRRGPGGAAKGPLAVGARST
ncbi:cupin domain-containing protein [Candidatus Methylacidithermus pantelleriae]